MRNRAPQRGVHSSVRDNVRLTSRTTLVDPRTSNHAQSSWPLSLPNDAAIKQMAAAFLRSLAPTQQENKFNVMFTDPSRRRDNAHPSQLQLGDVEPGASPRGSPHDSPRDSPRGGVRWSPRESPRDSPRESPRGKAIGRIEPNVEVASDEESDESGIEGMLDKSAAVIGGKKKGHG